jgi:hypothetical protein
VNIKSRSPENIKYYLLFPTQKIIIAIQTIMKIKGGGAKKKNRKCGYQKPTHS